MKNLLQMKFFPTNIDTALLVLRLTAIGSLFVKHGIEKITRFSEIAPNFPDPIGIGQSHSLFVAMIGDTICSALMVLGLGTRWAALFAFCNIMVAWTLVHNFAFLGKNPIAGHGELIVVYLSTTLTLLLAGPGKYSLDSLICKEKAIPSSSIA